MDIQSTQAFQPQLPHQITAVAANDQVLAEIQPAAQQPAPIAAQPNEIIMPLSVQVMGNQEMMPELAHQKEMLMHEMYAFISLAHQQYTQLVKKQGLNIEADKSQTQQFLQPFALKKNQSLNG